MPTLTELIKESLEGKLTDQIQASLASEDGEMSESTNDILKLDKKFSEKLFKVKIPEWKTKDVDQFFKKHFKVGFNELDKLNYTIISDAAFSRKFKYKTHIESCHWSPTGGSDRIDLDIWQLHTNVYFGSFHIPGNYKKVVILGMMKELILS